MDFDSYKPKIYIDSTQLPEIKKWKVGESYDLIITVKQVGLHEREDGTMNADFEIEKVLSADGNDPMELEDINNLNDNEDFYEAGAKYRARKNT